jgi:hypothetical protein
MMMRNLTAKIAKLEAMAASLPAPPPADRLPLSEMKLSPEALRSLLHVMRQHGAGPVTMADLVPFLPPAVVEEISSAFERVRQEDEAQRA